MELSLIVTSDKVTDRLQTLKCNQPDENTASPCMVSPQTERDGHPVELEHCFLAVVWERVVAPVVELCAQ